MEKNGRDRFFRAFGDELLFHSGQYALFYILMNFSSAGLGYFQNLGHTVLLFILVVQTSVLVLFGSTPPRRFFFSLLAPAMYTLLELREGISFVLNMGHMFFWISSIVTGAIQAAMLGDRESKVREVLEFLLTMVNVAIFMVVYFYFDIKLGLEESVAAGTLSVEQMNRELEISRFVPSFVDFLADPAHLYIVAGGVILAATLGIGRVRIIKLSARIAELFGQYVDNDVRDRILSKDGETIADFREVAILFSDIRDFTTLSEDETPGNITAMLNEYFSWWDREVKRHGGIIDKYIGDAVMVIFGLENSDTACASAVECALAMKSSLPELQDLMKRRGIPAIEGFGVGINYGPVLVGDIGSANRRNFTVVGDSVNVASRLESATKELDASIVISEATFQQLPEGLKTRFTARGAVSLKGRKDTIKVYSDPYEGR